MKRMLTGEELEKHAQRLGVDTSGVSFTKRGKSGKAPDHEIQRRVIDAERAARESKLWILALISAVTVFISTATALIAVFVALRPVHIAALKAVVHAQMDCCRPVSEITAGNGDNVVTGLAVDQSHNKIYMANGSSSSVLQCYNFDGSLCGTFASGLKDAYGLALEDNMQYIWVASSLSGLLERFNVSGTPNTPVETLNIARDAGQPYPHDVAVDSSSNVYGVAGTNLVKYIPGQNGHVVGPIKNLGGVGNEAVAVINGRVYVGFNSGHDSLIRVFDSATLSELTNVQIGPWPSGNIPVGITVYSGKIYVSFSSSSNSWYGVYNETGDGIKTPLRWNEVYHCGGYNEVKSIGIEGSEGLVLLAVKFGGKVLKLTPCQADLFNKK